MCYIGYSDAHSGHYFKMAYTCTIECNNKVSRMFPSTHLFTHTTSLYHVTPMQFDTQDNAISGRIIHIKYFMFENTVNTVALLLNSKQDVWLYVCVNVCVADRGGESIKGIRWLCKSQREKERKCIYHHI